MYSIKAMTSKSKVGWPNKRVARDRRPLADLLKPNGRIWAAARDRGR